MINFFGNKSNQSSQSGFTLLEMAISIMIVGIVLAMAGQGYSLYVENKANLKTRQAITNVTMALSAFKNIRGRYPCPAPLKEARTSANYGHEIDCSGSPPTPAAAPIPAVNTFLPFNIASPAYRGGAPLRFTDVVPESDPAYTNALSRLTTAGVSIENNMGVYLTWAAGTGSANCFDWSTVMLIVRYHRILCDESPVVALVAAFNAANMTAGTPGDPARALVPGQCLNGGADPDGICIEASTRTDLATPPRVRVGGIPFRDMQLEETDVIDGYGSRLVYAVTEPLANAATFRASEGGIEIQDAAGNVLSGQETSASFVVVSPGKNRNGAVDIQGTVRPCVTSGTNFDGQNCRNFATTTDTQSTYVMDAYAAGTGSFDDRIDYFSDTSDELWRRFDPTAESIVDLSRKNVGVGIPNVASLTDPLVVSQSTVNNVSDPTQHRLLAPTNSIDPAESFQSGALRVGTFAAGSHSGKILTNSICLETDTTKCFSPQRIAGAYDGSPTAGTRGMGCPAGHYMTGIKDGRALCEPIRIFCPPGQAVTGTDASGNVLCEVPVASCPSEVVNLCGTPYTLLPMGSTGTRTIDYTVGGACATATYACTDGAWVLSSRWGEETLSGFACEYSSATAPTSAASGLSCGTGYSGTYAETKKTLCNGSVSTVSSSFSSDCSCVGQTDDVFCDPSFGGGVVGTKKKLCTAGILDTNYSVFTGSDSVSYASESALTTALCSCGKTANWRFEACGAGKVRVSSPSTPAEVGLPDFPGWPADATQGVYYAQHVDMTSCTYIDGPKDSSNCGCSPAMRMLEEAPLCATCEKVENSTKTRQINNGPGCSWVNDPDTSANVVGTCTTKTPLWKSTGVVKRTGPLSNGRGGTPECDSGCSCTSTPLGKKGTCAKRTSTNWIFYKAKCLE
jgi:prepilin-type N-terminal cleavage/methylation domain-containing protein